MQIDVAEAWLKSIQHNRTYQYIDCPQYIFRSGVYLSQKLFCLVKKYSSMCPVLLHTGLFMKGIIPYYYMY